MGVGSVVLVSGGLALEGIPEVSGKAWLIICWLAVINTAVAFSLWNLALRRLSALESSAINNAMLIQIAVLGWRFLNEPLEGTEIAWILLVSVGVLLAQTRVPSGRARSRSRA